MKIISKAVSAFNTLFFRTSHWMGCQMPSKLRNGEVERKPGEMLKYLSQEEREALKDLKSDDLSSDKVSDETAKIYADETNYYDWNYYTKMLKEAKLAFDSKILKDPPRTDRKKY